MEEVQVDVYVYRCPVFVIRRRHTSFVAGSDANMIRRLLRAAPAITVVGVFAVALFAVAVALSTPGSAQQRPRPVERPPWKDVCCGGPCCAKPRPGR